VYLGHHGDGPVLPAADRPAEQRRGGAAVSLGTSRRGLAMCYPPRRMNTRPLVWLLLPVLAVSGCSMLKTLVGIADSVEPSVVIKSAETRWLLIKNPRFGDVPSEPEYVWVEEDKVPTTITTLLRGQSATIASPEIVAKDGTPPGGGKISPRQGTMYQTAEPPKATAANRGGSALAAPTR